MYDNRSLSGSNAFNFPITTPLLGFSEIVNTVSETTGGLLLTTILSLLNTILVFLYYHEIQ